LSPSLDLSPSRQSAIEAGIVRCGGVIVPYSTNFPDGGVGECDVFVTRWRSGRAYVKAVRENKTIGTLGWVFCVHATGAVTRPMDQLLHYPIPKRHIEGFSNHEITVTNYTGEAREYLKKLIMTMGARFTPSMSGKNTVLIAAYMSGTKTTKAAAWSIPIVNHTWLEDCFVKWRNPTVGTEKYIFFPQSMDFSKLLGER
ncbi:BRCT domain containing protein, partial [Amanita muscaria]